MTDHRAMFVFVPLFLALIITISTAPIFDNQLTTGKWMVLSTNETMTTMEPVTYDDDKSDSNETSNEQDIDSTTVRYTKEIESIPETITSGLLFSNISGVSLNIDALMKTIDPSLSEGEVELPATPTTDYPNSFEPYSAAHE